MQTHHAGREPNRLIHETSPYLRQHAYNPVDWHPWGAEALGLARELDRPIFLSIGYSACHWCHVMERESFEDAATAEVMNAHFVNIKVDREERPDLDQIYMTAVQLITMHGGWPMSVWLTPELVPFYGGTYFPPQARHGLPAFRNLLLHLADAWKSRRAEIADATGNMLDKLQQAMEVDGKPGRPNCDCIRRGARALAVRFDAAHGGLGHAPKFPHSVECRLLLNVGAEHADCELVDLALLTLDKMIHGGVYDQLGGGFHRYSTDRLWLVPHFEKMLYDNALIPKACLDAWQLTGRDAYRRATVETLEYLAREMLREDGPFFSTQDADSEGEEGKFFVWSPADVEAALGKERAEIFCRVYDVTPGGNWEGASILHLVQPVAGWSGVLGIPESELETLMAECRRDLLAVRERRVKPGRDEKILAGWNGLAIDLCATAGAVLGDERWLHMAERAADWILGNLMTPGGRLLRSPTAPGKPPLLGCLEDYAFLANGLLAISEAAPNRTSALRSAETLVDGMIELFWSEPDGGFYFTGSDHEKLIVRSMDPQDNATPSGNSSAALALVRLALLTGRSDLADRADRTFARFRGLLEEQPLAVAQMLLALRLHLGPTVQVAVAGPAYDASAKKTLAVLHRRFQPNKVVASGFPPTGDHPLLADRQADRTTVYLCRQFACAAPLVGAEAFTAAWEGESVKLRQ